MKSLLALLIVLLSTTASAETVDVLMTTGLDHSGKLSTAG